MFYIKSQAKNLPKKRGKEEVINKGYYYKDRELR
jgi:hypothetical protein